METRRRTGLPAQDPENPIRRAVGVGMGDADLALARRQAAMTGARSISEAIRGAIRNEFARVAGNA
jgi:hypothetical protein